MSSKIISYLNLVAFFYLLHALLFFQIVLTGDPKQLGPVLKSPFSAHYGLNMSLLERLMSSEEYLRDDKMYKEGYNPLLVKNIKKLICYFALNVNHGNVLAAYFFIKLV